MILIENNGYNEPLIIELDHGLIDIWKSYFIFPNGWPQLGNTPLESPNKVQILNRRYSPSNDNILDMVRDLRMQLNQLFSRDSCQVALAVVKCYTYCFYTVLYEFEDFSDYVDVGVLWSSLD